MTAKPKADKPDPLAQIEATTAMIVALTADVRRWRAEDRAAWKRITALLEAIAGTTTP